MLIFLPNLRLSGAYKKVLLAVADTIVEKQLQGPIVIATESQSLCKAMEQMNKLTSTILKRLSESTEEIIIQWVPGHSNIAGNEMADNHNCRR